MKLSLNCKKKRIMCSVLCAAIAMLTAAHSTAAPYNIAYAQENSEGSAGQTADTSEAESEEASNKVGGNIMDDCFGEITFYRWKRMSDNSYPIDNQYHPCLIMWGASRSEVLNPVGPSDIYLDKNHAFIEGAKVFGRDTQDIFPYSNYNWAEKDQDKKDNHNIQSDGAAALKNHPTANYKELVNNLYAETFYTTSDYNCLFAKYEGIEDGTKCPFFTIRLSNGKGAESNTAVSAASDYVINMNVVGGSLSSQEKGQMKITVGDDRIDGFEPLVFQKDSYGLFKILDYNYSKNNIRLVSAEHYSIGMATFDHIGGKAASQWTSDAETADIYFGEAFRFNAIKEDTTVSSGRVLPISAKTYIDGNNNTQTENGVVIPNGVTLTIEKGGVLSVSGDLINNGTIINNGGTIIVKDKGSIYPFRSGSRPSANGCGTIKCLGGDIIIEKGGAIYGGLSDEAGNLVPFSLDDSSTLINQGLLVYGGIRLGENARVECYPKSKTYGSWFMADMSNSKSHTFLGKSDDEIKEYLKALSERSIDYTYVEDANTVVYYENKPTEQLDMLSGYNKYFMEGNTGAVPSQLRRVDDSKTVVGAGLVTNVGANKNTKPHILVGSNATLNDGHKDTDLKEEKLDI